MTTLHIDGTAQRTWESAERTRALMRATLASLLLLLAVSSPAFAVLDGVSGGNDPSRIIRQGSTYYWYSTGGNGHGIRMFYTSDPTGVWQAGPDVFPVDSTGHQPPQWWATYNSTNSAWAPDITYHVNSAEYRLYYTVSAMGDHTSAIGLAVNKTLDPNDPDYRWVDRGIVIASEEASDFNALDPCPVRRPDATWFLSLGSHWGGIKLIRLGPDGMQHSAIRTMWSLAGRDPNGTATAIENSSVYPGTNNGVPGFWLFVNWGTGLAHGADATYEVRVGWSQDVWGPYLDKNGVDMAVGGGSMFLRNRETFAWDGSTRIGRGSVGIIRNETFGGVNADWAGYAYWLDDVGKRLGFQRLLTDGDGWPKADSQLGY